MKIACYVLLSAFLVAGVTALTPARPTCYIENNYEFQGNNISSLASTTSDNCCYACARVKDCRAWTWSDYNGGTCWFKTTKDEATVVVKQGVKSAYRFDMERSQCELHEDVVYDGNDLVRVNGQAARDCCGLCQQYPSCRAFTWTSDFGGSCFLKSARGRMLYKQGVVSARAYPVPYGGEGTCGMQFDIEFVGSTIANVSSATPDGCCDLCYGNYFCWDYTWTNDNGGTCFLKSYRGDVVNKPGAVSSQTIPNREHVCDVVKNVEFKGGDIAQELSSTAEQCCGICNAHEGCAAYTWTTDNGGTCWLKNASFTRIENNGVISGKTIPYH